MTEALIKRRQDARPYRIRNYKTLQQPKPKIFIYRLVFNQKPTDDQEQRDMDKINNTIYSITPPFCIQLLNTWPTITRYIANALRLSSQGLRSFLFKEIIIFVSKYWYVHSTKDAHYYWDKQIHIRCTYFHKFHNAPYQWNLHHHRNNRVTPEER